MTLLTINKKIKLFCLIFLIQSIGFNSYASNVNNEIVIETAQFIDNINPFSYTVYPAELIVQFTTEKLIQQLCTGSKRPSSGYTHGVQRENQPVHQYYDQNSYMFHVDLKSGNIYQADVAYSVNQINQAPDNRFYEHKLEYKNNRIRVNYPKAAFNKSGAALTFPLIKVNQLNHEMIIKGADNLNAYNQGTTGIYSLKNIQQYTVELKGRTDPQLPPINFKVDILWDHFFNNIMKGKVHVGLNVNGDIMNQIPKIGSYRLEETVDLNSFTYFGFNYNSKNEKIRKIFKKEFRFRHAFAYAVSSTPAVKDLLYNFGDSMNHTFDTMRIMDDEPTDYMYIIPGKVRGHVLSNIQNDPVTMRILFRADLLFTQEKMDQIVNSLNSIFSEAKINFRTIRAPKLSEFISQKSSGNFEIIFDTFVFGQNKLRYIEFMNPENSRVNYLNCRFFHEDEIITYKNDIEQRDDFLIKVNKWLPVFVVGTFRSLNVISTQVNDTFSCGNDGRPIPFTNIHKWQIRPVTNQPPPARKPHEN